MKKSKTSKRYVVEKMENLKNFKLSREKKTVRNFQFFDVFSKTQFFEIFDFSKSFEKYFASKK